MLRHLQPQIPPIRYALSHAAQHASGLVALVHWSDLLCRMRGFNYGYYERGKVDRVADPAWEVVRKARHELQNVDLACVTFELDGDVKKICEPVSTIFGSPAKRN